MIAWRSSRQHFFSLLVFVLLVEDSVGEDSVGDHSAAKLEGYQELYNMVGSLRRPHFLLLLLLLSCSSKFRPSLRLEDLNSSSLMLPVVKDNNVDEEAQLDARIERVRRLLGQFEVDEQDSFSAFYDGEEEFVYNDYSDSFEDFRSPEEILTPTISTMMMITNRTNSTSYFLVCRSPNALAFEDWDTSSSFIPSAPLPPTPEPIRDVRIVVKSLPGAGPRLSGELL